MAGAVSIRITNNGKPQAIIAWNDSDQIVLGRQRDPNEERFSIVANSKDSSKRLPFAIFSDARYSREQVRLTKTGENKISIENISSSSTLKVAIEPDVDLIFPHSFEQLLPTTLTVGEFSFRVERALHSLGRRTIFHSDFERLPSKSTGFTSSTPSETLIGEFTLDGGSGISMSQVTSTATRIGDLIDLLSNATSVIQQATSKDQLYSRAIEAVKRLIDVDGVVVAGGKDWKILSGGSETIFPSRSTMEEVTHSGEVRWSSIEHNQDISESQTGLDCYMAAPIVIPVEMDYEVVSVLYAHRVRSIASAHREAFTELHAKVFELIACSIAAGIVRIDHQAAQNRFQQFFTPSLAKELMKSDALLEPSEREITVLFCDIRRFSSISERLTPTLTSEWVQDVLSGLSDCVLQNSGVLVDYTGDELMAMWGAPQDQPDHAALACQCANDMIALMPSINAQWLDKIGTETQVGIGINTGMANVGNTGSKHKFKYGPLGDTVNRASRMQGLTKYLKVDVIMTGETKAQLPPEFKTRRLGKAKVVNIDQTIELFQLFVDCQGISELTTEYELSLEDLERGNWAQAALRLKKSLDFAQPDHPTLLMMNELINRVILDQKGGDFEWDFKGK